MTLAVVVVGDWKADNMECWWCFYSRTDSRYQPQYCLWFAAWLPCCVLVQEYHRCWQLSFTCTTATIQDISSGQHCWQQTNHHLFIYSSWTAVQSMPVLDWQLAKTAIYLSFKTMLWLGLLTACRLWNNCTVCSVYVMLTHEANIVIAHSCHFFWKNTVPNTVPF